MWTTHPECATIINSAWSKSHVGSHAYKLGKKIATIRDTFRKWNKEVFGRVEREIEKKKEELQCIQENITSVEDIRRETEHREQLEQLLHREEISWSEKARKEWDLKGDRNTKYYQAVCRNRRRHNKIIQIKNEEDVWIFDQAQIEQCFCNYFHKLYADTPQYNIEEIQLQLNCLQIPSLTDQQRNALDQPMEDAEILQAIHQLGPLKAPGPDGIPAAFYQKFWPIVQQDVLHMVKAFFHSGFLLKSLNHTFITLIPIVPTPERVTQFRPISLCNVSYKIISKILVNRLKPLMDGLITPFQNAFVQGRQITDNIILAHEIFEYLKKKGKGKWEFAALKVDMNKAYNRISWPFLTAVLKTMGFSDRWITWVSQCVQTISYSILLNGSPTGNFKPNRGLRQGDPLSPYLFLLCANILSCALLKQETLKNLKGIKI